MLNKKALAGAPSTPPVFVEDVFSTYLYTGNGSTQTITNGIDLAGKGGAVWIKSRSNATSNVIFDTVRGIYKFVATDTTNSQDTINDTLTAFNSTGFTLGSDALDGKVNTSPRTYCSWTFREQKKFFDVVTYTGTGSATTIAHNLGSVPGSIWVKRTDTTGDWQCYHRSLANTEYLVLNTTAAKATGATRWNSTTPTSTVFSLGTDSTVNANGGTYVAYLFAHDAGGFGTAGTDNVITCGSFTVSGSRVAIDLGYEPQWLLIKEASTTGNWRIVDSMRGIITNSDGSGQGNALLANTSGAESNVTPNMFLTATGFTFTGGSATYIYIAIRRGPMKTPTSGTSVFSPNAYTGDGAASRSFTTPNFAPDLIWTKSRSNGTDNKFMDRLRGTGKGLNTNDTGSEGSAAGYYVTEYGSLGYTLGLADAQYNNSGLTYVSGVFRRAPGFFDQVCYTGTGSNTTFSHNLGVVPELMIVKNRSDATGRAWAVYAGDNTDYLVLNTTAATADDSTYWNDTSPTSSVFSVGTNNSTNESSDTFVAYLFATVAGVSKVGSYTGTGTTQTINCGFTAGARFVMIKRTDSTGDWYVWDTARNIISGNDPYLLLNSNAAEVTNTDYIDPVNSGFELSSTAPAAINANGGSFIFMAIA